MKEFGSTASRRVTREGVRNALPAFRLSQFTKEAVASKPEAPQPSIRLNPSNVLPYPKPPHGGGCAPSSPPLFFTPLRPRPTPPLRPRGSLGRPGFRLSDRPQHETLAQSRRRCDASKVHEPSSGIRQVACVRLPKCCIKTYCTQGCGVSYARRCA